MSDHRIINTVFEFRMPSNIDGQDPIVPDTYDNANAQQPSTYQPTIQPTIQLITDLDQAFAQYNSLLERWQDLIEQLVSKKLEKLWANKQFKELRDELKRREQHTLNHLNNLRHNLTDELIQYDWKTWELQSENPLLKQLQKSVGQKFVESTMLIFEFIKITHQFQQKLKQLEQQKQEQEDNDQ